jgi:pyrroline-5-carboxylate reductase
MLVFLSLHQLAKKVASKGGTTQAVLDSMEDNNVGELIKEAAFSAFDRAVEMGK